MKTSKTKTPYSCKWPESENKLGGGGRFPSPGSAGMSGSVPPHDKRSINTVQSCPRRHQKLFEELEYYFELGPEPGWILLGGSLPQSQQSPPAASLEKLRSGSGREFYFIFLTISRSAKRPVLRGLHLECHSPR